MPSTPEQRRKARRRARALELKAKRWIARWMPSDLYRRLPPTRRPTRRLSLLCRSDPSLWEAVHREIQAESERAWWEGVKFNERWKKGWDKCWDQLLAASDDRQIHRQRAANRSRF